VEVVSKIGFPGELVIECRRNDFFVENETLGIFATGETREEAKRAFDEHLIYFYNHYKKLSWDRVTGEAERLKRLYEDLFQDVTT
jgi:hypothetical protein